MKYDLDKIRWQVLRDMGWTTTHPDTEVWIAPEGYVDPVSKGRLPDPAREAVDMLTVMEAHGIVLSPIFGEGGWCASDEFADNPRPQVVNDVAQIAVCLLALDKAGHNIEDFEVTP